MKAIIGRIIRTWMALPAWLFLILPVAGQELQVHGEFLADSIKIGEELPYVLTARYPETLNILFPDSTTLFLPFEYSKRHYFPTHTIAGISVDSVVYYLRTFETERYQQLSLPVYVAHPADCTIVYPSVDTVLLHSVVVPLPDSVSLQDLLLKETVAFEHLPASFNYVTATLLIGVLMATLGIGWILFGNKIQRYYQIKRLRKNHDRFVHDYTNLLEKLKKEAPARLAESTINIWKKYLENLDRHPYTKLTTKETIRLIRDESIANDLHIIDRAIYGNYKVTVQPFEELGNFANNKFIKKLEEVKNG